MFRNHLRIALRHLVRGRTYAVVNITGLSVGMAACILISLWVHDELSYDLFHKNVSHLYRVISHTGNFDDRSAGTPAPLGPALKEEIPDVVNFTRFAAAPGRIVVRHGNVAFYEDRILFADPEIFEMFTFPFLVGNRENAFSGLSNVVITDQISRKYFGGEDPIGKVLTVDGAYNLVVSGVVKNIPAQSHIQFDFLLAFQNVYAHRLLGTEWGDFNFTTFVQLRPGSFNERLQAKVTAVAAAHNCPQVVYGKRAFGFQPMTDVHLDGGTERAGTEFTAVTGDRNTVGIFSLIALLTLGTACFNFMNIATARSEGRRKEVATRKTFGAHRYQLAVQFLCESALMTLIACFIAVVLIELLLPTFNTLTGKNLVLDLTAPGFIFGLVGITVLTALLAGSYPALYLSSFTPISVLNKHGASPGDRLWWVTGWLSASAIRKGLVIAQFSLSTGLIICTLVAVQQLQYIQNRALGFDKENVIVVPVRENFGANYAAIKNQLLGIASIAGVTAQEWFQVRGPRNTGGRGYDWEGNTAPLLSPMISHSAVDYDFIRTMNIAIVEGRDFSRDHPDDAKSAFIVNEEAVRVMGLKSPVGRYFRLYGQEGKIIGVMRNAYFSSLHRRIEPLVYHVLTDLGAAESYGAILVRIQGSNPGAGIAAVEKVWKAENPNSPFEFQFLDDAIAARYSADRKTGEIFGAFACIALFISCLGALGLASFTAESRTKEIGIRKVLGASVAGILVILTGELMKWVLIANIIAWPVAWYSANKWLQNFAYRIDTPVMPFVVAGFLVFAVAGCTVIWQSLRAATANPVRSMRYE